MILVNENYLKLQTSYLFVDISRRVAAFQEKNPEKEIIRLGIGDVTQPLPKACIAAFHEAIDEMGNTKTFRGYGPEQGYSFLRSKIAEFDYKQRNVDISQDEIFISDGAKCDTGNIQEIFAANITIAIPDPVYPVYLDTNVMAGRAGDCKDGRYSKIVYLNGNKTNGFVPDLPKEKVDLIYLCYPNNPTGSTITKEELARWVDFAKKTKALILYDAAYEAFIKDDNLPKSIYEIDGAKEIAIEFRSFSKTAGFTGTRCAFTVIPKECAAYTTGGEKILLNGIWNRRHSTKFNGVSYPVQKAAEAIYSLDGRKQVKELIDYYMENASIIRSSMNNLGYECIGGENSPYIWVDCKGIDSWAFFDLLLNKAGVVTTPGAGFGKCGEGYIRISAFNNLENVNKAMRRIAEVLKNA